MLKTNELFYYGNEPLLGKQPLVHVLGDFPKLYMWSVVLAANPEVPGSIPGAARVSE
jgi:hypothetical protein